jgi:hypothetical protein
LPAQVIAINRNHIDLQTQTIGVPQKFPNRQKLSAKSRNQTAKIVYKPRVFCGFLVFLGRLGTINNPVPLAETPHGSFTVSQFSRNGKKMTCPLVTVSDAWIILVGKKQGGSPLKSLSRPAGAAHPVKCEPITLS